MEKIKLFFYALSIAMLTGCGHNIGTCIHGKVFNIGYDPELNKVGIQYYDGIVVTGLQKEKSKTSLNFTDTVEGKNGVKTISSLVYGSENGDQITGYGVDAIKAASSMRSEDTEKSE